MRSKIKDITENTPFIMTNITDENFVGDLSFSGHTIGDVICYSELYDELIAKFGSYEGAKAVYCLCRDLISNGGYISLYEKNGGSVPYIDIELSLNETITDNGLLTPVIERWVVGKQYNVGDMVYYSIDGSNENMIPFVLKHGDRFEEFEIPYEIYVSYFENPDYSGRLKEIDGKYYLVTETYSGNYNPNYKQIYFDDIDSNGNLVYNHWDNLLNVGTTMPNEDTGETVYELTTESVLNNLKRKKVSMDDDCNTLPFIPHYVNAIVSTGKTECLFMLGITNIQANQNGAVTCDYLKRVSFVNDDRTIEIDHVYDPLNANTPILCDNTTYSGCTKVEFEYYIGIELDESGSTVEDTGVKYIEERTFTVEHMTVTIDRRRYTDIPYFDISDKYVFAKDDNADLENSWQGTLFSTVSLDEKQIGKTEFSNINVFKYELLNGVQDIINDVDGRMNRGIATSFERHNALGEINTMQDLEHYRNDFFDISNQ